MHIWGEVGKSLVALANGKWPFWFAKSVGPATTTSPNQAKGIDSIRKGSCCCR